MTSKLMDTIKKAKKFNNKYNIGSAKILEGIQSVYEFDDIKVRVDYLNSYHKVGYKDTVIFWNKEWRNNYIHEDVFFYWEAKYRLWKKVFNKTVRIFGYDADEFEIPKSISDAVDKAMDEVIKNEDLTVSMIEQNMRDAKKEIEEHSFGLSR